MNLRPIQGILDWRQRPVLLPAAAGPLEIPLQPSVRLRRFRWLLLALIGCHVAALLVERHWAVAAVTGLCGAIIALAAQARGPVRLLVRADGRCFLFGPAGDCEEATLQSGSMFLGSHVLLVWSGAAGGYRMVLGPDNLAGGQLAALRRRLSRAAAGSGTALHSVAAQGSKSPNSP